MNRLGNFLMMFHPVTHPFRYFALIAVSIIAVVLLLGCNGGDQPFTFRPVAEWYTCTLDGAEVLVYSEDVKYHWGFDMKATVRGYSMDNTEINMTISEWRERCVRGY